METYKEQLLDTISRKITEINNPFLYREPTSQSILMDYFQHMDATRDQLMMLIHLFPSEPFVQKLSDNECNELIEHMDIFIRDLTIHTHHFNAFRKAVLYAREEKKS